MSRGRGPHTDTRTAVDCGAKVLKVERFRFPQPSPTASALAGSSKHFFCRGRHLSSRDFLLDTPNSARMYHIAVILVSSVTRIHIGY